MSKEIIEMAEMMNGFVIDHFRMVKTKDIYHNTGQISGLPKNPRYILEKGQEDLKRSINEVPEFLFANKLVIIPYDDAYVVICGNMRLFACIDAGILEVPCIVLNPQTPVDKLKRLMVIDNLSYGKHDYDILANEFEALELEEWGLELPGIDLDTEKEEEKIIDPKCELTIVFKGNLEHFDRIRQSVENLIDGLDNVTLK